MSCIQTHFEYKTVTITLVAGHSWVEA